MGGCVPCMAAALCWETGPSDRCTEVVVNTASGHSRWQGQQGKSSTCTLEMKDRAYLLDLIDLQKRTEEMGGGRNRNFS